MVSLCTHGSGSPRSLSPFIANNPKHDIHMGARAMTPHARRAPAFPVVLEVLPPTESPWPRSSSRSWITTPRPARMAKPTTNSVKHSGQVTIPACQAIFYGKYGHNYCKLNRCLCQVALLA
jgi:hypothetical protein